MFDKKKMKELDLQNLDQIIAKCEEAMLGGLPSRKKKAAEMVVEVKDPNEESDEQESGSDEDKPEFSEADVADLLEALKDRKDEE